MLDPVAHDPVARLVALHMNVPTVALCLSPLFELGSELALTRVRYDFAFAVLQRTSDHPLDPARRGSDEADLADLFQRDALFATLCSPHSLDEGLSSGVIFER